MPFDEVVLDAVAHGFQASRLIGDAGHHHNRQGGRFSPRAEKRFPAGAVGQGQVQQRHVKVRLPRLPHRLGQCLDTGEFKLAQAALQERFLHQRRVRRAVLHQQNFHLTNHGTGRRPDLRPGIKAAGRRAAPQPLPPAQSGRGCLRQGHQHQPERFNGMDDVQELLEIHRLGNVTVGVVFVGLEHVLLGAGSGQHHHGNGLETVVGLDFGQDFAAILARKIQVQQNQVRARRQAIFPLAPQEFNGLHSVLDDAEAVADFGLPQRLDRQVGVAGTVFDQQDFNRAHSVWYHRLCGFIAEVSGSEKKKVEPRPGSDSTQMSPWWRSTIFLQMARPMPVPG